MGNFSSHVLQARELKINVMRESTSTKSDKKIKDTLALLLSASLALLVVVFAAGTCTCTSLVASCGSRLSPLASRLSPLACGTYLEIPITPEHFANFLPCTFPSAFIRAWDRHFLIRKVRVALPEKRRRLHYKQQSKGGGDTST